MTIRCGCGCWGGRSLWSPHRAQQLHEQLIAGSLWKEHGLVFSASVGTPIWPANLLRSLHKLLDWAGLPSMRFHDLRHSCASFLAAQNIPPKVMQEILGHSDIRTTLRIYTHTTEEQKRQAAEMMDALLGTMNEGVG